MAYEVRHLGICSVWRETRPTNQSQVTLPSIAYGIMPNPTGHRSPPTKMASTDLLLSAYPHVPRARSTSTYLWGVWGAGWFILKGPSSSCRELKYHRGFSKLFSTQLETNVLHISISRVLDSTCICQTQLRTQTLISPSPTWEPTISKAGSRRVSMRSYHGSQRRSVLLSANWTGA